MREASKIKLIDTELNILQFMMRQICRSTLRYVVWRLLIVIGVVLVKPVKRGKSAPKAVLPNQNFKHNSQEQGAYDSLGRRHYRWSLLYEYPTENYGAWRNWHFHVNRRRCRIEKFAVFMYYINEIDIFTRPECLPGNSMIVWQYVNLNSNHSYIQFSMFAH